VIVDFAHNEAGTEAILEAAAGIAAASRPRATVTAIIGTAGDRPDDTLRGIGRIAARTADRVAIKETPMYLRGRNREDVVQRLREGIREGGADPHRVPVHESEVGALGAELAQSAGDAGDPPATPSVIVLFCHAERDEVFALLERVGAVALDPGDALWGSGR
jgi:cyanophycin synthetase